MKICNHNKSYYNCKICYPKGFCDHNKRYSNCKICYPKWLSFYI